MLNDNRTSSSRAAALLQLLRERIVIIDGAMGTMIQSRGLDEAGYRGAHFKLWGLQLSLLADAVAFVILILILLIKPSGLLGKGSRDKV